MLVSSGVFSLRSQCRPLAVRVVTVLGVRSEELLQPGGRTVPCVNDQCHASVRLRLVALLN